MSVVADLRSVSMLCRCGATQIPVMHTRPPGSSWSPLEPSWQPRTGRRHHRAQRAHGDASAFTPSSELHTL
eukprot:7171814-Prymnesium_polylepis.1